MEETYSIAIELDWLYMCYKKAYIMCKNSEQQNLQVLNIEQYI